MLVVTRALTKTYRDTTALDRCELDVSHGEVLGLLGPNGAGKTTLLRLLMGYLRPTAGTAAIDGFDCYRQSVEVHRRTAYLPGDARLFATMRGGDVLRFFCNIRGVSDTRRAEQFVERLELNANSSVATMSTGMRQKLALAAVLAADTPLVVLDEPTSNLDPSVRREVVAIVQEAKQAGRTVIFSSHILDEVEETCDRVCILRRGQVVHTQVMSELRRQHRISARLTGPLPPVPAGLASDVRVSHNGAETVTIDTPGELSPLLGWLSTLPVAEVRIEPFRLRSIYDQFHAAEAS